MSTAQPGGDRNPVEALAEEFLDRQRRGEPVTAEEYASRYPDLAEEILALFPALVMMEELGGDAGSRTGSISPGAEVVAGAPAGRLGEFRLLREIGRGGMGIVFEAEQESLGRRVALKVLPANILTDQQQVRRFEREARAAAKLHHTNIVPVFGVGQHEGTHFYVMQFIQGQGLDTVLEELRWLRRARSAELAGAGRSTRPDAAAEIAVSLATGRFETGSNGHKPISLGTTLPWAGPKPDFPKTVPSPTGWETWSGSGPSGISLPESDRRFTQSVARIGLQVAEALAYAHGQGILHRDIKPSNLLLDRNGTVWVADFGLAKAVGADDLTHTGDIVGTVRYMAPERFEGQGDARADIYALGLTLYELVAVRPAFEEKDRASLIRQVTQEEPPRLRTLNRKVPADLETIVHKAMAREPAQRYATAAEFAEDLRRFIEGRPIRARRVSAWERAWRWCRRNPIVAGLTATVFLLLALVAGVASIGYVREAAQHAEADRQRTAAEAAEAKARQEAQRARQAEQETRRQWYAASINLMQPAWDTGQIHRLRALLAETEPFPDRSFEWYYFHRLCHLELHTLIGHRAPLAVVSWSPDGKRLATGSADGTTKVWDATGGRERLTLRGHAGLVTSISWSPDSRRLATGSGDTTAKVWDLASGRNLLTLKGHTQQVNSVSWSRDGQRLATGSWDRTAKVWDAADGRDLLTLKGHESDVVAVSWSPDSQRLMTASEDGFVKLWNAAGRNLLTFKAHLKAVNSVSWSPEGDRLATGSSDGTARVWDAADGRNQLTLKGHTSLVISVCWSPEGKRLATASFDGTARVWEAAGGRERLTLRGHTGNVGSVSWSPDGTQLATGSWDGTAKVWDASGSREPLTLKAHISDVSAVAWSPAGDRLATGSWDGTAKVWDTADSRELLTLKGHASEASSVCWAPDGQRLATGSWDGTARVWEAASGRELLTLKGQGGRGLSVAWSPDGQKLATGSIDGTAAVWDAATGRELSSLRGHTGPVTSVSWSPEGQRLATGSHDATVRVWDAAGGREQLTFRGHTAPVTSVSWSPDGERLVTGSYDGTARLWDTASGQAGISLKGHTNPVISVSWSPDGKRLATGSNDGTAKVWDAAGGRELLTLPASYTTSVSWSPEGRRLATGGADGAARVWQAASAEAVQAWASQEQAVQELFARNAFRGPQAQGFLQSWLLLLPIPLPAGTSAVEAVDQNLVPAEAQLQPRPGDRVLVGGQPLAWQEFRSPEAVLSFNVLLGRVVQQSVAYAVCYLECNQARDGLWLQVGTDDEGKVYLNGREIYTSRLRRAVGPLDMAGPLSLKQGTNVLMIKVVNEGGSWEGCARLVDDEGLPVQGIRVKLSP